MQPRRSKNRISWIARIWIAGTFVLPLPAAAQLVEVVPNPVELGPVNLFGADGEATVTSLVDDREVDVIVELIDPFEGLFRLSSNYEACWANFLAYWADPDNALPLVTRDEFNLDPRESETLVVCGIPNPNSSLGGVTLRVTADDGSTITTAGAPLQIDVPVILFGPLGASTFFVDSEDDAVDADPGDGVCATSQNECTLRAAVQEANATPFDNAIVLPEGRYTLAIEGAGEDAAATGDLDVTDALVILGPGADLAVIDGAGLDRVFHLIGARLQIERIGITGGLASEGSGGGIYAVGDSRLELFRCAVFDNEASQRGGGILAEGTLDVVGCTVSGNTAVGFVGGGIAVNRPKVPISRGPGPESPQAVITNTTVSGNRGAGAIAAEGSTRLEYVTVTDNEGGLVGVLPDSITLYASIVANQSSSSDCVNTGVSEGYSLQSDGSCDLSQPTDLGTADPLLGPLSSNGARTPTHALLPLSPALGAVPPVDCTWDHDRNTGTPDQRLPTDQRGEPRPQEGACDVGAFEVQPAICAPAPAPGCIAAGKAKLSIKEKKPGKEKLSASLKKLQDVVGQGDFGDPVEDPTRFDLCLYDDESTLVGELVVDRGGESCGAKAKPCWKRISDRGYKYNDKDASADGVKKILAKGGDAGRGKLKVQAANKEKKGQRAMPTGIASDLQDVGQATVQLLASGGRCYEAVLTDVKKADGVLFKAKGP